MNLSIRPTYPDLAPTSPHVAPGEDAEAVPSTSPTSPLPLWGGEVNGARSHAGFGRGPKPLGRPGRGHCAYDRCQAGGVILDGAPMVIGGGRNRGTVWHPGCHAAAMRAGEFSEPYACSAVDPFGLPCTRVAGAAGEFCASCRSIEVMPDA